MSRDVKYVGRNLEYSSTERFKEKVKQLEEQGYRLLKSTKTLLTYVKD